MERNVGVPRASMLPDRVTPSSRTPTGKRTDTRSVFAAARGTSLHRMHATRGARHQPSCVVVYFLGISDLATFTTPATPVGAAKPQSMGLCGPLQDRQSDRAGGAGRSRSCAPTHCRNLARHAGRTSYKAIAGIQLRCAPERGVTSLARHLPSTRRDILAVRHRGTARRGTRRRRRRSGAQGAGGAHHHPHHQSRGRTDT